MKYPPGYPAFVALGELLFPGNLLALRALTLLVSLACVGAVSRMLPESLRWPGTILFGTSVTWANFATTVDSAPLYTLLLVLAVILC